MHRVNRRVAYNLFLTSVYDIAHMAQAGLEVGRRGIASPLWVRNFEIKSKKIVRTLTVSPVICTEHKL